jgi:Mycothiol-dependent nitroreductase Rv2466c
VLTGRKNDKLGLRSGSRGYAGLVGHDSTPQAGAGSTPPDAQPTEPILVRVWVDPGCPWAWQTVAWLRDLRDRGLIELEWKLFSLEINSSEPDVPFWEAAATHGESLVALLLARDEGGPAAFETLYAALGRLDHDDEHDVTPELVRKAAAEAEMPDIVDRAVADPSLPERIRSEYLEARALDVFGVPTLQIPGRAVIYGPILPLAPTGDDALEWWRTVRFALEHDDLYELKRWPRDRRPGRAGA